MKSQKQVALYIAVALLAGCDLFDPLAPAPGGAAYNYDWGFINSSPGAHVDGVTLYLVRHGELVYLGRMGVVPPSGPHDWAESSFTSHNSPVQIPDTVIIRWEDPDSPNSEQTISLAGLYDTKKGNFKGTIWFRYFNHKWYPAVLTTEQMNWQASHGLTNDPQDAIPR
jgi:hypothetical protein